MRSSFLTLPLAIALGFAISHRVCAAEEVKMDDATKKATAKALLWLKEKQNSDGSWSDGRYLHNTAITSFAMLAYMAQGHLPNQGLHGPEVAKGARFLMAAALPRQCVVDGKVKEGAYIIGARGGNMYCHGMATLVLAELWGSTGDDEIKPILQKAVDLIIGSQSQEGGWRYEPNPHGADISVTIMQVMALRAAKNAGIHVPNITLKKAIAYIDNCYRDHLGGFTYMPRSGAPGFARTAAGVCVLYLASDYKDLVDEKQLKRIEKAVKYLHSHFNDGQHFYYGHYYAAHAMHRVGGEDWKSWYGRLVEHFVDREQGGKKLPARVPQNADGSWSGRDGTGVGPVYQTSIATIVLSVPANYLPIFQR